MTTTIPFEDAVRRLPPGFAVHTYRQAGRAVVGEAWGRDRLLVHLRRFPVHPAGPDAAARGYGLAVLDHQGWLFIQGVA